MRDVARHFHAAVVIPHGTVIPADLLVVQDDEVPHFLPLELALGVEAFGQLFEVTAEWEQAHQADQGNTYEMNAGRLER
ncbi:MAG TPA: hypothetical protein VKB34_19320, partial [Povalibacter sp.]|nr:hypothetical protein [Povalibacter sp.]